MKRLSLYLLRWQLSTPVLAVCMMILPLGNVVTAIIANLIGGLIFFKVDEWIFNRRTNKEGESNE